MKSLFLILTLLSLLVASGMPAFGDGHCLDELGCVEVGPDDPIVVGAMLTVSGATAFLGEDSRGGVELAILARDNTLLGRDIELTVEDSLCSAEGGQAAAQRLTADEAVVGIIGTNCSSAAQGALPIVSDAGMLMIAPSNTSPSLTNDDIEAGGAHLPGYFRSSHNDLFLGAISAQFAVEALQVGALATVHDGDPYTEGAVKVMADTFAELGGEVVFQGAVNKGDTDMAAILTEIAASQPDIIYFPLFEPESNFLAAQSLHIPGLEDVALMTAAANFAEGFPENTGDAAIGIYVTGPLVSGETYEQFLVTWDDEIGGAPPGGYHAHAYDATNILLDAVEAVAQEAEDGSLVIGRQALRDAIAAVENYPGLTGRLTCQDESPYAGDCATGTALAIFQITEAEVYEDSWPPPTVDWDFAAGSGG